MTKKYIVVGITIVLLVGFMVYYARHNTITAPSEEVANSISEEGEFTENQQESENNGSETRVVMFHNGTGPMCIDAIDFFKKEGIEYEEHLTTDSDFSELLSTYESQFNGESEGVSTSFGYYPIIFVRDRAFSGFDEEIGAEIMSLLDE